jgi:hypothetical protein
MGYSNIQSMHTYGSAYTEYNVFTYVLTHIHTQ